MVSSAANGNCCGEQHSSSSSVDGSASFGVAAFDASAAATFVVPGWFGYGWSSAGSYSYVAGSCSSSGSCGLASCYLRLFGT